ncbi:hypothetical protein [Scytonema sp. PCC 10023]|uniref:hypothetical protein n=1 Tax=Scytonema sp. PCC 10023 TaxID=1680591 RepID=UPI0039C759AA
MTSATPNQRLRCRLPNLTIGFSWLFPFRVLHHLPSRAGFLPYDPGRPIAQAVSVPHSPCVLLSLRKRMENTPTYCVREASRREVFTQLQNRAHLTRSFWLEPLNSDGQGTDRFMPFAVFTTQKKACPFESRQPLVIRYIYPNVFVRNCQQIYVFFC